jgi:hypothetical protein
LFQLQLQLHYSDSDSYWLALTHTVFSLDSDS